MNQVAMPTTKIMVIRDAEKPDGTGGVMRDGTPNLKALTAMGWQRAYALVRLFAPADWHFADPHLAIPQTIYGSGLRSQQTVTPLAERLALPINLDYLKRGESALLHTATAIGGIVLIAWPHEGIPGIAWLLLGGDQGVPQHWPGNRFDLVWVFDRPSNGKWIIFTQVPQRLMVGDSTEPIPLD